MPKKDLTGQRFGKLVVLQDSNKRASNGAVIWQCQCDCGNITEVVGSNLTRKTHPTQSCGCKTNAINLTGQKFHHLLALEPTDKRSNDKIIWKCQCDCGNIHYVHSANLISGAVQSCGKCFLSLSLKERFPKRYIATSTEIIGSQFGGQLVLADSGQREGSYKLYECECINCHTKTLKTIKQLRALKSIYCHYCSGIDITGQRFGLLIALREVQHTNNDKKIKSKWECKCDCGNVIIVQKSNLISGNTTSCGCRHMSKGASAIQTFLDNHSIAYEIEKTFDSCIFPNTNQKARFDFFLPDYNLLIEYDGEQHFHPIEIFTDDLTTIQARDQIKNEWCAINQINLLRIPYYEFKNIDNILLYTLSLEEVN